MSNFASEMKSSKIINLRKLSTNRFYNPITLIGIKKVKCFSSDHQ